MRHMGNKLRLTPGGVYTGITIYVCMYNVVLVGW